MLKKVHRLLLTLVVATMLITPVVAEDEIPVSRGISQQGSSELIQNEINVEDSDIKPINTESVKKSVVPDPHKEGKKVVGLFIKTMLAVIICSALLYLILLFSKRFYAKSLINSESEELETFDLSTPNNKNDALKSFLNRTK